MSSGWENHEAAPLEHFHGRLMELFHEFRKAQSDDLEVLMSGSDLNSIIAKAKMETYAKYPKHVSQHAIPKSEV